jgi:alkylation response protein AidB-like acyl-CoA dehydrogenase
VEVLLKIIIGQRNWVIQLRDFFNKKRNHVAAQGVGVAQGALEMAISQ